MACASAPARGIPAIPIVRAKSRSPTVVAATVISDARIIRAVAEIATASRPATTKRMAKGTCSRANCWTLVTTRAAEASKAPPSKNVRTIGAESQMIPATAGNGQQGNHRGMHANGVAKMAPIVVRDQPGKLRQHRGRDGGRADGRQYRSQLGSVSQRRYAPRTKRSGHRLIDQRAQGREHRSCQKRNVLTPDRGHFRVPAAPGRKNRDSQPAHAPCQDQGFCRDSRQGSPA